MKSPYLACLLTILLCVPAIVAASSQPPLKFLLPPLISTISEPHALTSADLNGDHNVDLIVGLAGAVEVFLGKGNGTFPKHYTYALTNKENSFGVAVADLNNDHIPDLVVVTHSSIQILLGNGDGTFQSVQRFSGGGVGLTVADFNGDGKLDVAVMSTDKALGVYLGNGDGTFQPEVTHSLNVLATSIVSADFNGDGKVDLAISDNAFVRVLFGNGDGTFQTPQNYKDSGAYQIAIADMNSDGFVDIITVDTTGIAVLQSNGKGKFSIKRSSAAGLSGPFVVGDFNNDGKLDIALSGMGIFLGKGDGTVRSPNKFYADSVLGSISVPGRGSLVAADINNDHKVDVIQIYFLSYQQGISQGMQVFFGGGDGTLRGPRAFAAGGIGPNIVTGDFNNDGKVDVASLSGDSFGNWTVSILLGNGNGTFQPPLPGNATSGGTARDIATGDFNHDGKLDLVVLNNTTTTSNGVVNVFLGNGDGTFQPAQTFVMEEGTGAQHFAVADFNRDSILDIAVVNSCIDANHCGLGTVGLLIGNGDGTFQNGSTTYLEGGSQIVAADFNNDGVPDIAVTNGGGSDTVRIFSGNGDGTFQFIGDLSSPNVFHPWGLTAQDFNGDGNVDLAIVFSTGLYVVLGNGNGEFGPFLGGLKVGAARVNPVAADLNGDGILDIATDGGQVLLGNGDGTFQPVINLSPDAGGLSVQTAILGNDALPNIVYGSGLPIPITVFVNLGR